MARKKNYLNNRDILAEIHKSKNTYCSYLTAEDADYDIILSSIDQINSETIAQAKQNHADRLARAAWQQAVDQGGTCKLEEFAIDANTIDNVDLVFRITTFEHIPQAPDRKKNPKTVQDRHVRLNFPPFQHFRLDQENATRCVGKSHWIGGLHNGYFSVNHGHMTNRLGQMFIKLCDRYGSKWNWRNYSYNDEMRAQALLQLSQVGLQFDESKSQNPFAYYSSTVSNSFTRILNVEKRVQNIRDDILEIEGYNPSSTRQYDNYERGKID